ncbi:unnamed protein product [Closterium sp. Naga37s-1]|nr:unnamed protein product [Closterium sp. Naga37s-1]
MTRQLLPSLAPQPIVTRQLSALSPQPTSPLGGPSSFDAAEAAEGELSENDFHRLADEALHWLHENFDVLGDEVDIEGFDVDLSQGVLTLRLGQHGIFPPLPPSLLRRANPLPFPTFLSPASLHTPPLAPLCPSIASIWASILPSLPLPVSPSLSSIPRSLFFYLPSDSPLLPFPICLSAFPFPVPSFFPAHLFPYLSVFPNPINPSPAKTSYLSSSSYPSRPPFPSSSLHRPLFFSPITAPFPFHYHPCFPSFGPPPITRLVSPASPHLVHSTFAPLFASSCIHSLPKFSR